MQKPDITMEALNRKRDGMKGLDLTIVIGGDPSDPTVSVNGNDNESVSQMSAEDQNPDELKSKTDLAPPNPQSPPESDLAIKESGLAPDELSGMDSEMLGQMPAHDQADLANRKPRSLGEAARKAALDRQAKG